MYSDDEYLERTSNELDLSDIQREECYYCHRLMPLKKMRRIEVWEEYSKSGGSLTVRGSAYGYNNLFRKGHGSRKGGGVSYNLGRINYKKVKAFACYTCLERNRQHELEAKAQLLGILFWLAVVMIGIIVVLTII